MPPRRARPAGRCCNCRAAARRGPRTGGEREHKDLEHEQPRDALHEPPPLRIVTPARRLVESACRRHRTVADRGDLAYSRAVRFSFLNGAFLSSVAVLAVGSLASCSSGGGATGTGGSSVTGSAGTGGSTGSGGDTSTGTGGSVGPGAGFPTQACIDRANGLLAQMTLDEKAAQTIQAERAQITNAQVMQYGVGSIYSQGGSSPSTNTPAGWAAMISAYRTASRASAHGSRSSTASTVFTAWDLSRAPPCSRTTSGWARSATRR